MNIIGFKHDHDTSKSYLVRPKPQEILTVLVELPPQKRTLIHENEIMTNYYRGEFPWTYFWIDINIRGYSVSVKEMFVLVSDKQARIQDNHIQGLFHELVNSNCLNCHSYKNRLLTYSICMYYRKCNDTVYSLVENVIDQYFSSSFTSPNIFGLSNSPDILSWSAWTQGHPLVQKHQLTFRDFQFNLTPPHDLNQISKQLNYYSLHRMLDNYQTIEKFAESLV